MQPGDRVLYEDDNHNNHVTSVLRVIYDDDIDTVVKLEVVPSGTTILFKQVRKVCPARLFQMMPDRRPCVRQILQWMWGDIVFRRVSRTIAKHQDMSIWWRDSQDETKTRYLGDDKSLLKQYSEYDIARYISIEYDYFYGFTRDGALHSNDPYAGESLHYASQNYWSIDFCADATGEWKRDYTVNPVQPGQLVCGIAKKTPRGITYSKWWQCPEEFYRLWKMIMFGTDLPIDSNLKRLRGYQHVFQALALVVIYGKNIPPRLLGDLPTVGDDEQPFIEAFMRNIMWMNTQK